MSGPEITKAGQRQKTGQTRTRLESRIGQRSLLRRDSRIRPSHRRQARLQLLTRPRVRSLSC